MGILPVLQSFAARALRARGGSAAEGKAELRLDPDDALERTYGSGLYQLIVCLVVGLGFYSFSFPFQVMPVFTDVKMAADAALPAFTKESLSLATVLLFFGWLGGSLLIGPMADKLGRRPVVFGAASGLLLCGVAAALVPSAASSSYAAFAAAKLGTGFFVANCSIAIMLVQECIPGSRRGAAVVALNIGYSLAAVANALLCGSLTFGMHWRPEVLLWYVPVFAAIVLGLPRVGESLRYLAARGRTAEANALLAEIARTNGVAERARGVTVVPPAAPEAEAAQAGEGAGKGESLFSRKLLPRVLALAWCWVAVSMTNYGLGYSAGELSPSLYRNAALLNVADIVGSLFALNIDRFGRKPTQATCFLAAGFCLVLCGLFKPGTPPVVACALLGRLFVCTCFTTVYILVVELFPTSCRSLALSVCLVAARVGGLFAPLSANLPAAVSCPIFGMFCLVSAVFTCRLPETAGQKLG